jgi:hypothetical protein
MGAAMAGRASRAALRATDCSVEKRILKKRVDMDDMDERKRGRNEIFIFDVQEMKAGDVE